MLKTAFDQEKADFFGIAKPADPRNRLYISQVFHKAFVKVDEKYFRPSEVDLLLGDPSKAKAKLGWTPRVTFKALVKLMIEADLESSGRRG